MLPLHPTNIFHCFDMVFTPLWSWMMNGNWSILLNNCCVAMVLQKLSLWAPHYDHCNPRWLQLFILATEKVPHDLWAVLPHIFRDVIDNFNWLAHLMQWPTYIAEIILRLSCSLLAVMQLLGGIWLSEASNTWFASLIEIILKGGGPTNTLHHAHHYS